MGDDSVEEKKKKTQIINSIHFDAAISKWLETREKKS